MTGRKKNRGRVYLRRSDAKQETSLETQLGWATTEAVKLGMPLEATSARLERMLAERSHHQGDIYLDNAITGANLERAGFRALIQDVLGDRSVSHVFTFKRDRLGRPDDPIPMMAIEQQLTAAGVTLVFSDGIASPSRRGQTNLPHIVEMLFSYHQSGEFLKQLAERIILTHRHLAQRGFRTGGNPPYGFGRYLIAPDGTVVEELPHGRYVRQPGFHVRALPKDKDKIAIWVYILELKFKGWGVKRIAQHLNELGIPSPGAGTIRTDHGVRHTVSGKWSASAVSELCRNEAILGVQSYGRRAEGSHRRLGPEGPRLLEEGDQAEDGSTRMIFNDPSLLIKAPAGFDPQFDEGRWTIIQEQMATRSKNQRGVRRAKDPSRYPLGCRVFDLTSGCGSVMYGVTAGKRPLYKCGRYQRTAGAQCHHNAVDAEALLRFTLRTLVQLVERRGGREKLRELLRERAANEADMAATTPVAGVEALRGRIGSLREELTVVERRMATERDEDRYQAIAGQFDRMKKELKEAEETLSRQDRLQPGMSCQTSEADVDAALSLFDTITKTASDPSARNEIPTLLARLGLRIGLRFGAGLKGRKREVRELLGGVVAFGDAPLPVPIHGRDNCNDGSGSTGGLGRAYNANESVNVRPEPAVLPIEEGTAGLSPDTKCQQEGVSFTKDSRDDRIRTCDLLTPSQAR